MSPLIRNTPGDKSNKPSNRQYSLLTDLFDNDRFFDNNWFENRWLSNGLVANVKEGKRSFVIELAVPGIEKEDLQVSVEQGALTITAQKEKNSRSEREKYTRQEFSYTSFSRAFTLPGFIDVDQIDATYKNGILTILLPKEKFEDDRSGKSISIR